MMELIEFFTQELNRDRFKVSMQSALLISKPKRWGTGEEEEEERWSYCPSQCHITRGKVHPHTDPLGQQNNI
ncbi:unnamed protein product [Ilex paraguariensis]|uniref:Uncharacterized protein n=1 Tax=Ilex paraguariensis TaxID=185542 RepID=A0ABC8R1K4_9AQUA